MKKLSLFTLLVMMFGLSFAQVESTTAESANAVNTEKCGQWLSIEHEFVKAKNYTEAEPYWQKLYKECPSYNKAIYIDGVKIYKYKIKNEKNAEAKKELARKMIQLYDDRLKYFPDNTGKVLHDKGVMMVIYHVGTPDEIYAIFDEVFKNHPEAFTHPKAYWGYFDAAVKKYKKGELKLEDVFNLYDKLEAHLNETNERLTKKFEELSAKPDSLLTKREKRKLQILKVNLPAMAKIQGVMDKSLGDLGNCQTLVPFYAKKYDENKDNVDWLGAAANRLAKKECTDNDLFQKIVASYHKLNPSAQSALYLAIRAKKEGQYRKAMEYYKNAAQLETNPHRKAEIYYSMAVLAKKMGNRPLARKYAYEALKYKPSMGYAYLLVAGMYARSANECGNTRFEKLAIYWKAAELARKAAAVDPTLSKKALQIAREYEKRAPSKKEVFLENMGGKTIKFDKCWVGGSVRVPAAK
ncbi:MAG: hypothetical protein GXO24_03425 [Chlorobi bacterium]|nr:hypothetical protein [Chlorobiota bacterium]